jgi:hypothetical protein
MLREAIDLERLLVGSTRSQSLLELQISRCKEGRIDIQAVYDAYQAAQDTNEQSGFLAEAAVTTFPRASRNKDPKSASFAIAVLLCAGV